MLYAPFKSISNNYEYFTTTKPASNNPVITTTTTKTPKTPGTTTLAPAPVSTPGTTTLAPAPISTPGTTTLAPVSTTISPSTTKSGTISPSTTKSSLNKKNSKFQSKSLYSYLLKTVLFPLDIFRFNTYNKTVPEEEISNTDNDNNEKEVNSGLLGIFFILFITIFLALVFTNTILKKKYK